MNTVDLYVKPWSSTSDNWTKIDSFELNGFGRPGVEANYSRNYYYTTDYAVRLRAGGTQEDVRTDVVINNITVKQWRGENEDLTDYADSNSWAPTNFVYTSGWVTKEGALRLSARRTSTDSGSPASIRSPLLDGYNGHGRGLGMLSFKYRHVQPNTVLLVQVVTNYVSGTLETLTKADSKDDNDNWKTVDRLTANDLTNEVYRRDFGLHGVRGLMRIVLDKDVVASVTNEMDEANFGEIDILEVTCQDEPPLDAGCWWGWNLRTVGDSIDTEKKMYLTDFGSGEVGSVFGRSFALNNSIADDLDPSVLDQSVYKRHLPFLQSPTFTSNVVGEVSFKARVYETNVVPAYVTLYGMRKDGTYEDKDWEELTVFTITNTTYQRFGYKIDTSQSALRAFRFAVTGVEGVTNVMPQKVATSPVRVLLDEVTILEALRAELAFRNVAAFRSQINDNKFVPNLPTKSEQPLMGESWGVQAEVYASSLEAEIDKTKDPEVLLHWFVGREPWGYENWKDFGSSLHHVASLSKAEGTDNQVYRSSNTASPAAVITVPNTSAWEVVQYMLEVRYQTVNSQSGEKSEATNWLEQADWTTPSWYSPVDYNTDKAYGASKNFAAFSILDSVAPGWAWVNEVNLLGTSVDNGARNSEWNGQYVEIAAPAEADLTDWKVRFLELHTGNSTILTNTIAQFGTSTLSGMKKNNLNEASNMVFRAIVGNRYSSKFKESDGSLDGAWEFSDLGDLFAKTDNGIYYIYDVEVPLGVQLVRPSGVVEHSVCAVGTNYWGKYLAEYSLTNYASQFSRLTGCDFVIIGEDCAGEEKSLSVVDERGETAAVWTNAWVWTPGRINSDGKGNYQKIDPDHPTPQGESVILYARLDNSFGHIYQSVGSVKNTTEMQTIILKRGNERGTNIVYKVDPWYELGTVTETESGVGVRTPSWTSGDDARTWVVTVGAGASNNVTVVAAAAVDQRLREQYGLDESNPYTPAVVDWLTQGKTVRGNFKNVDNGEIHLAEYMALNNNIITNLTLTQMYWLDMDPTASNLIFKAGISKPSTPAPVKLVEGYEGDSALTNVKMSVFMMISNQTDGAAWSPYTLRGLEPGSLSMHTNSNYKGYEGNWTSVTFKVTGILANGNVSEKNPNAWVALRWFVFDGQPYGEESFWQATDEESDPSHKKFTTDIEIVDPHSTESPGYAAGWYEWEKNNGYAPIFNSWNIDTLLRPIGVETLKKENYLVH